MSKIAERTVQAPGLPQYSEVDRPSSMVTNTEASVYFDRYNESLTRPDFVAAYQRDNFSFWADRLYEESRIFGNPEFVFQTLAFEQLLLSGVNAVIPLIFRRIDAEPVLWLTVLPTITGNNPVKPSHEGQIRKMVADWKRWARGRYA